MACWAGCSVGPPARKAAQRCALYCYCVLLLCAVAAAEEANGQLRWVRGWTVLVSCLLDAGRRLCVVGCFLLVAGCWMFVRCYLMIVG